MSKRDEHGLLGQQDQWDFPEHSEKARRIRRARGALGKKQFKAGAHGTFLAMLVGGGKVAQILKLVNGSGLVGQGWTADVMHAATHGRFNGQVELSDEYQRSSESPCARAFVRLMLNLLAMLERNGPEKLSVMGRNAFWGKSYEPGGLSRDELERKWDEKELERDCAAEATGPSCPKPKLWRLNRKPLRKLNAAGHHQQAGLALRIDREVRQVQRYLELAELAGLFRSFQPKAGAPDAVMPRNGSWAYPEITALREPPELVIQRLQKLWGDMDRAQVPLPRAKGEPKRTRHGHIETARGPPRGRLSAVEPDEYLHRDMGLSLTELDDYEQSCGLSS